MGKTTTVRSILNLAEVRSGTIEYEGEDITGHATEDIAQRGIGYAPEERDIFSDLTVTGNLKMAGVGLSSTETEKCIEEVFERFPKLRELEESKGGHLSGGNSRNSLRRRPHGRSGHGRREGTPDRRLGVSSSRRGTGLSSIPSASISTRPFPRRR